MTPGPQFDAQIVKIAQDVDLHELSSLNAVQVTAADWHGGWDGVTAGLGAWWDRFDAEPDLWFPLLTADDLQMVGTDDRVGVLLGLQNGSPIEDRLDRLPALHRLGIRLIQPTYNTATLIADGCLEPRDAGLSRFGVRFVKECNRLGIAIDISHVGARSARDIVEASEAPVLSTHSNSLTIAQSPRNKEDSLFRALVERGGVVGVSTYGPMCWRGGDGFPTFAEDFVAQVAHVLELVGEDSIAIGSDSFVAGPSEAETAPAVLARTTAAYPEIMGEYVRRFGNTMEGRYVEGFQSIADWKTMRERLRQALGLDDDVLDKLLGGNWLRVFGQTLSPSLDKELI